jgi:hypothetical protein
LLEIEDRPNFNEKYILVNPNGQDLLSLSLPFISPRVMKDVERSSRLEKESKILDSNWLVYQFANSTFDRLV